MAKRNRKQKIPPQQRRDAPKIRRPLWILLISAGIIGLLLAGAGLYSQLHPSQSQQALEKAVTPPSETPQRLAPQQSQLVKKTGSHLKSYEQGFLAWEITEKPLPEGKKQVAGTVRWNEKSGASGEPVRQMPVMFARADHEKQELIVIANGRTDDKGQFTFTGDAKIDTVAIGKVEQAANLPAKVFIELEQKTQSKADQPLGQTLRLIQDRVNAETAWGRKVRDWIRAQRTEVFINFNSPAPAMYDATHDRIVANPDRGMPPEQQIAELKKGYLHNFILPFHEDLHRAQNRLSGKTKANPEMALLREIHAYWISHLLSVDDLFRQIYEHPHGNYTNLARIDHERFGRLCAMMDWLYAFYEGDFDKLAADVGNAESIAFFEQQTNERIAATGDFNQLAAFVGNADSIADFEQKAKAVIEATEKKILEQRREQMRQEKEEWKQTTARLAQDVLK